MKTKLILLSITFLSIRSIAQISQNTSGQTGFNNTSPSNRVEITSNTGDPYFGNVSTNGASGLRFTNLTSNKTPLSSTGKVLTVDANGDVILVPDNAGTGTFGGAQNGCSVNSANLVELGNSPGATQALLSNDREIPQNNHIIQFTGSQDRDRVHIGGTNGSINYGGRLSVENHMGMGVSPNYGYGITCVADADVSFVNSGIWINAQDKSSSLFAPNNIGAYASSVGKGIQKAFRALTQSIPGTTGDLYGLHSTISNVSGSSGIAYGVRSEVSSLNSADSYAGYFDCISPNGVNSYGILSKSGSSATNYAGYFTSYNSAPTNYGIFANATNGTSSNYGIYATVNTSGANNWAGYFNGDVFCTGNYLPSDMKYKKDINNITNSLETIKKLRPVSYYYKNESSNSFVFPDQSQFGFISQEVEKLLPQLTKISINPAKLDNEGKEIAPKQEILSLNYIGFIPLLTKAIQEQQTQIENQQQQINELKALVNSLVGNTGNKQSSTTSIPVNLSDKNAVVLNQNVPNPFAESTVINYNIPNSFSKAQIIFSTNEGKVVKAVDITEKSGSLNVFANDLSNGIYQYSLVVDGKTIETKTMIKQ